jgi:hypothetical protein
MMRAGAAALLPASSSGSSARLRNRMAFTFTAYTRSRPFSLCVASGSPHATPLLFTSTARAAAQASTSAHDTAQHSQRRPPAGAPHHAARSRAPRAAQPGARTRRAWPSPPAARDRSPDRLQSLLPQPWRTPPRCVTRCRRVRRWPQSRRRSGGEVSGVSGLAHGWRAARAPQRTISPMPRAPPVTSTTCRRGAQHIRRLRQGDPCVRRRRALSRTSKSVPARSTSMADARGARPAA